MLTTVSRMTDETKIAVVLNAHENSPVFNDTLDSIRHHWTNDVLVVVDGKGWNQFENIEIPALKLEGFVHGKDSSPYRNMCLGLMKAWDSWGETASWYAYVEYDCLVGSKRTLEHLNAADEAGLWLVGNDLRQDSRKIPFINKLEGSEMKIYYLLGCCLFFNRKFMKKMAEMNFFERFLTFTNFHEDIMLVDESGKNHPAYDLSEFLYPSLAVKYGGKLGEMACWLGSSWRGHYNHYPMRFRPDLMEEPFKEACVMHPLKDFNNPVRSYHRNLRTQK